MAEEATMNAKIVRTKISPEEIGIYYSLEDGNVFCLGGMPFDINTLFSIMSVIGVDEWEQLPNKIFRIKIEIQDGVARVLGFGNAIENAWIEVIGKNKEDEEWKNSTRY